MKISTPSILATLLAVTYASPTARNNGVKSRQEFKVGIECNGAAGAFYSLSIPTDDTFYPISTYPLNPLYGDWLNTPYSQSLERFFNHHLWRWSLLFLRCRWLQRLRPGYVDRNCRAAADANRCGLRLGIGD